VKSINGDFIVRARYKDLRDGDLSALPVRAERLLSYGLGIYQHWNIASGGPAVTWFSHFLLTNTGRAFMLFAIKS
jgi:hypothetical protein